MLLRSPVGSAIPRTRRQPSDRSCREFNNSGCATTSSAPSPKGQVSAASFPADVDHATAVARRLRTGRVDINGAANNMLAPFGGFKQSGIGREFGWAGFEEFLEIKAIQY